MRTSPTRFYIVLVHNILIRWKLWWKKDPRRSFLGKKCIECYWPWSEFPSLASCRRWAASGPRLEQTNSSSLRSRTGRLTNILSKLVRNNTIRPALSDRSYSHSTLVTKDHLCLVYPWCDSLLFRRVKEPYHLDTFHLKEQREMRWWSEGRDKPISSGLRRRAFEDCSGDRLLVKTEIGAE